MENFWFRTSFPRPAISVVAVFWHRRWGVYLKQLHLPKIDSEWCSPPKKNDAEVTFPLSMRQLRVIFSCVTLRGKCYIQRKHLLILAGPNSMGVMPAAFFSLESTSLCESHPRRSGELENLGAAKPPDPNPPDPNVLGLGSQWTRQLLQGGPRHQPDISRMK